MKLPLARRSDGIPLSLATPRRIALGIGLVAIALAMATARPTLLGAWLVAWVLLALPSLGAMALLMVHGLTGGAWGRDSEWLWRGMAALMPLLALALLPLLLGLETLFPWTAPTDTLPDVVRHKLAYLNAPFFVMRTLFYLAVWSGLAIWLARPATQRKHSARWHAPGLIVWALTLTFFCYDWLMSLEPAFYSDIYGLEIMAFSVTTALALGILLGAPAWRPAIRLDLANLWLAVLLAWAFFAFSQLIIIWSANLPHEIDWYLKRGQAPWLWMGRVSVLLFLLIPFAMLLPTSAKSRVVWLRLAAASGLLGYLLHVQWLIWPALAPSGWALLLGPLCLAVLLLACLEWLEYERQQPLTSSSAQEARHDDT